MNHSVRSIRLTAILLILVPAVAIFVARSYAAAHAADATAPAPSAISAVLAKTPELTGSDVALMAEGGIKATLRDRNEVSSEPLTFLTGSKSSGINVERPDAISLADVQSDPKSPLGNRTVWIGYYRHVTTPVFGPATAVHTEPSTQVCDMVVFFDAVTGDVIEATTL